MEPIAQSSPCLEDGFLLVNKPSGPTTYDLIRWLKKGIREKKIGHSGTLDPLASGLVVLLVGKATKRQAEFMGLEKTYWCQMKLGVETDTGDVTGRIMNQKEIPLFTESTISSVVAGLLGEQNQIPPMFSAVKVNGKPLYKYARKKQSVERAARKVTVYSSEFLKYDGQSLLEFRVRVSSGTYVRSLVEAIGKKLNAGGTVTELCRETIGNFHVKDAIPGDRLKGMNKQDLGAFLRI